ncbi:hypothetical protein LOC51_08585 [Rubrivivax sp. JA1024]|nr:hypothetical protein [Rubrivivax sp. JA1024]
MSTEPVSWSTTLPDESGQNTALAPDRRSFILFNPMRPPVAFNVFPTVPPWRLHPLRGAAGTATLAMPRLPIPVVLGLVVVALIILALATKSAIGV